MQIVIAVAAAAAAAADDDDEDEDEDEDDYGPWRGSRRGFLPAISADPIQADGRHGGAIALRSAHFGSARNVLRVISPPTKKEREGGGKRGDNADNHNRDRRRQPPFLFVARRLASIPKP